MGLIIIPFFVGLNGDFIGQMTGVVLMISKTQ